MKIYRKTYGVKNLMEWQATIPVGKGRLIIHFAGGTRTAYGVTPATYKTEDPIRQAIIEKSDYFHSGRIFLVKSDFLKEAPDTVPSASTQKPITVEAPAHQSGSTVPDSGEPADINPSSEDAGIIPVEQNDSDSDADNGQKEISIDENGFATVEVTCTEDARRYLIDNFGFTPSAVRTKEFIRNKAAANKIKFTVNGAEL